MRIKAKISYEIKIKFVEEYSISELCKYAKREHASYYKWLNRSETKIDKENKLF